MGQLPSWDLVLQSTEEHFTAGRTGGWNMQKETLAKDRLRSPLRLGSRPDRPRHICPADMHTPLRCAEGGKENETER